MLALRVTLIHNPGAGEEEHAGQALRSVVEEAGHEVRYQSMREPDWERALAENGELVAVAGGDGSVGKVFRELATSGALVTLLPVGSANNVGRAFGIADDDVEKLVHGWVGAERRRLDVGRATASWGEARFLESFGGGIFSAVFRRAEGIDADVEGDEKVTLGLELLREVVSDLPARAWGVEVDGDDLSAELIAVEAMNIGELGPNVLLAPTAVPDDGLLDVVLVEPGDREALVDYLAERLRDREPSPPSLEMRRGQRVVLHAPRDAELHADDRLWPEDLGERGEGAAVVAIAGALTLLVPSVART